MDLIYKEESYKIRGAVFEVYKKLGCGHKEVVYQRALKSVLLDSGLRVETEKRISVIFNGESVGTYTPDLLINQEIIIELKAKPFVTKQDIQQFWHYLTGTNYKLGFLINFGKPGGVEIIRRVYDTARVKVQRDSALDSALFREKKGFSLVEAILASSVFVLLVTALIGAYLYGQESTALAGSRARAAMLAEEGLEAARNIRDENFANLTDGAYGLGTASNQWILSGSQDITDIFTRQMVISTVDAERKSVTANIIWQQNPQRAGSVSLTSRFTNWLKSAAAPASCNDYAVQQGYSAGTCRENTQQCTNNGEAYLPDGDAFCVTDFPGDPSHDTCCALP